MQVKKIDYHIHSTYSPDGESTPLQIIKAAAEKKFDEIIFTDHCECNNNEAFPLSLPPWPSLAAEGYIKEINSYKGKYALKIGVGVELGQATQGKAYAEQIIKNDFDLILGSLHNVRGEYDFCYIKYDEVDIKKLMEQYFKQLYELVLWGKFDVLAHMTYPLRYIYRQGFTFDTVYYDDIISEILKALTLSGKGLEINTSGLSDKCNTTFPSEKYIRMFREYGGEFVTVGSDSHQAANLGINYEIAFGAIINAGFTGITTYEKRKPLINRF